MNQPILTVRIFFRWMVQPPTRNFCPIFLLRFLLVTCPEVFFGAHPFFSSKIYMVFSLRHSEKDEGAPFQLLPSDLLITQMEVT